MQKRRKNPALLFFQEKTLSKSNHIRLLVMLVLSCLKFKLMKPALGIWIYFAVIYLFQSKFAYKSKTCLCLLPHLIKCKELASCREIFVHAYEPPLLISPQLVATYGWQWLQQSLHIAMFVEEGNKGNEQHCQDFPAGQRTQCARNLISCPVLK